MHKPLHAALAVLRFFNLLEPGKPILSITKIAMWISVVGLAVGMFTGHQIDITGAGVFFTTASLYAWRRFVQWKTGTILGDNTFEPTPPAGQ
ncbi:MAG: hypothetical protein P4M09_22825 [Devosia sp.]|nr:hypothetical protein [Devosia sp.]